MHLDWIMLNYATHILPLLCLFQIMGLLLLCEECGLTQHSVSRPELVRLTVKQTNIYHSILLGK